MELQVMETKIRMEKMVSKYANWDIGILQNLTRSLDNLGQSYSEKWNTCAYGPIEAILVVYPNLI